MKQTMICQKSNRTFFANLRKCILAGLSLLVCTLIALPVFGQEPLLHIPLPGPKIKRIPARISTKTSRRTAENNNFFVPSRSRADSSDVHVDSNVIQAGFNYDAEPQPLRDMKSSAAKKDVPWTYQLRNLSYDEFENKLSDIWGRRLLGKPLDGEQRTLRIFFPEGTSAPEQSMKFDRIDGMLTFEGAPNRKAGWQTLMQAIDRQESPDDRFLVKVIDVGMVDQSFVQKVSHAMQDGPGIQEEDPQSVEIPTGDLTPEQQAEIQRRLQEFDTSDLEGVPTIRQSPETNSIIVSGLPEDVAKITEFLKRIIAAASVMGPKSEVIPLYNSQPAQLAETLLGIYESKYLGRHGEADIVAVPNTNSLIVIGNEGAIDVVTKLARQFDGGDPSKPSVEPDKLTDDQKGFVVYRLGHISAINAKRLVDEFFGQAANTQSAAPREAAPVTTIVEERSNSITIIAGPDLRKRAVAFLKEIDQPGNGKTRIIRIFAIKNQIASALNITLADILGSGLQQNQGFVGGQNTGNQNTNQNFNQNLQSGSSEPVTRLTTLQIRGRQGDVEDGGAAFDARITSNDASNTLAVVAPERAMGLIEELIEQLDKLPNLVSEVKVFPIINGDAGAIIATLDTIFTGGQQQGQAQQQTGGIANLPLQSPGSDGASLLNLRFALHERTNTIIASGSVSDLEFVEALINRLDENDTNDRQTRVYRLSNAFATDVSTALNNWLTEREGIIAANPITGSIQFGTGVSIARRDVIVVDEAVSNSLIVNARPEYFAEIEHIIEAFDRRPPLVKVKAMIVQIDLNQLENFGVEFGIQDSSIFEAGLSNTIGTGFIGLDNVAGQLATDIGVGRSSPAGLILSAGDESLNFILRFLKQKGCASILFCPQIMTLENLEGRFTVGSQIQRQSSSNQVVGAGVTQSFENVDIGVTLAVTPRVSPDGMVVMFVDVANTALGNVSDGTAIGIDAAGNAIISRPINQTVAQTAVMCRSGQTVAITGLIQEGKNQTIVSVPILGDLPVIGPLFRSVDNMAARKETLIILTPFVVDGADDINAMNEDDFNRMHWCKCDVAEVYGNTSNTGSPYYEQTPKIYYPDDDPLGANPEFENERQPVEEQFPRLNREPGFQNGQPQNRNQATEPVYPADDGLRNGEFDGSGSREVLPTAPDQGSSSRNYPPQQLRHAGQGFDYQRTEQRPQYNPHLSPPGPNRPSNQEQISPQRIQQGYSGQQYQQPEQRNAAAVRGYQYEGGYDRQPASSSPHQSAYRMGDERGGRNFTLHPAHQSSTQNYR